MSEEVKRPDLLIYAMKHALPGTINPVSNAEQAHHIVEYIESLESKLGIAEEALEFYADKENFTHRRLNGLSGMDCDIIKSFAMIGSEYAWGKAQQALTKIRGEG